MLSTMSRHRAFSTPSSLLRDLSKLRRINKMPSAWKHIVENRATIKQIVSMSLLFKTSSEKLCKDTSSTPIRIEPENLFLLPFPARPKRFSNGSKWTVPKLTQNFPWPVLKSSQLVSSRFVSHNFQCRHNFRQSSQETQTQRVDFSNFIDFLFSLHYLQHLTNRKETCNKFQKS